MGITAIAAAPGSSQPAHVYLRVDGLRVEPPIVWRRSGASIKQSAHDGTTTPVTASTDLPVSLQLYAYASAEARSEKAAPIWSAPLRTTISALGLEPVHTPAELWEAIYGMLRASYPDSADDLIARFPVR